MRAVTPLLTPLLLLALAGAGLWPGAAAAQADLPLQVVSIVLSERELAVGQPQIAQITLRNGTAAEASAGVRLVMRDAAGRRVGGQVQRTVTVGPYDESRVLFRLSPPRRRGEYRVHLELFSTNFRRRLSTGEPGFYAVFNVGAPTVARAEPRQPAPRTPPPPGRSTDYRPPGGLAFEAPDLVWENVEVDPPNFLVGQEGIVRADLRNVGGDIARGVDIEVRYFNTRIPARTQTIAESAVPALAPGDREQLEFAFAFPDDALLGEYRIELQAAAAADSPDATPDNNTFTLPQTVRLSNIRLVFPDPNFSFDEAGLFLFRWESSLFDEFKVQVGVDPDFRDEELFFDIPQGGKWTQDQEVVPLSGELPGMAKGLMLAEERDTVYWRVMGRDADTGRTGFSNIRRFTIQLEEGSGGGAPGDIEQGDLVPLDEGNPPRTQ